MISNVFVDESGTMALANSDDGPQGHYVIACLFTNPDKADEAFTAAAQIVGMHARGGELKSSKIGSNSMRRAEVLGGIREAGLGVYALVVAKDLIYRDSGLRFGGVSYKFLHEMFYSQLEQSLDEIHVLADQYGDSEFMQSFQEYVGTRRSLFSSFNFAASAEVPILQIADVVAGSIRRVFDGLDGHDLLEVLGYPSIPIEIWPPERTMRLDENDDRERDASIQSIALSRARRFIEENVNHVEDDDALQVRTLRFLLQKYYEDPHRFISRAEIVEAISLGDQLISPETLSRSSIAKLRNAGVVLVSTDNGVKLPSGYADIVAWLDRIQSQVVPYLGRLEKARGAILVASENTVDILTEQHVELQHYVLGKERMRIKT